MEGLAKDLNEGISILAPHLADCPVLLKPLKVLGTLQAFFESGGQESAWENMAALQAIVEAAKAESPFSEAEKKQLIELLKRILRALAGYGYRGKYGEYGEYGYPSKTKTKSSIEAPIEVEAAIAAGREEAEGLEWDVVVVSSGRTVDGRDFYPPDTIRRAVELFNGVQCFIDHPADEGVPSVTRLAGWLTDPRVVEQDGKTEIHATLHVLESSPVSRVLKEIYQRGAQKTIGLSINARGRVHFEASENGTIRVIDELESVESVDLVTKPNAGGALLRLRAAVMAAADELAPAGLPMLDIEKISEILHLISELEGKEENKMEDEVKDSVEVEAEEEKSPQLDVVQLRQMVAELGDMVAKLKAQLEEERAQRAVEAELSAAGLPEAVAAHVRERVRNVADLELVRSVIQEAKSTWAVANELAKASMGSLTPVEQPKRKVLRLQGLVAGSPVDGVEPYTSLREAFGDITGSSVPMSNHEFASTLIRASQGFDSALIRETIDTSDWSYMLGQAIHREMIRQYRIPAYDDWRKVCSSIGSLPDMRTQDRLRYSYFNLLPEVNEEGTYQPAADPSEQRAYFTPSKRGMLVSWNWEAALNDDLGALRDIPRRLALSAKLTVWYNVLNIFAASTPPTCSYDGVQLFHATHGNLDTLDLSASTFGTARAALMKQTAYGSNYMYLGVGPKYLLVPPEGEGLARQLRNSEYMVESGTAVINPWRETFDIIVVPFWSDNDAWALVADPQLIPTIEVAFLGGKEEPELFTEAPGSGSSFTADKVTYKIRHVWGYCILDHRGMWKSTGA